MVFTNILKGPLLRSLLERVKSEVFFVSVLVIVVFFVFKGYFLGQTAPPWDFYGDYYTQAFSWWDLGSFFYPTTYLPYLISGYPSHLGLQVSSYYLPVGFVAEFFEYSLENAAKLQATTILFGVLGVYVLARKQNFKKLTSVLIGMTFLFSAGFFSNASHIDIVRAWAFFPWLLIVLIPTASINRWKLFGASLLWFQFFVGAYPGNIASFAYACIAWIVIQLISHRDKIKTSLTFYAISIGIGIFLSMPKFLPFLLTGNRPRIQNQVVVDFGIISTIFFPYGGSGQSGDIVLPNDLTQRTFFVIPLVVLLAFFANRWNMNRKIGMSFVLIAILLGIDTPIFSHWQENLPLLNISRFRTIDFKPILVLGLAFLGGVGFERILNQQDFKKKSLFVSATFSLSFLTLIIYFAKKSNIANLDIQFGLFWILISCIGIILMFLLKSRLILSTLILTIFFTTGLFWANHFVNPWNENRVNTENLYFGDISSNLIKTKQDTNLSARPARVGPAFPIPYPGEMIIQFWNANELKRQFSTGVYVTIKGEQTFQSYVEIALDAQKASIMQYLSNPSSAVFTDQAINNYDQCFIDNQCNKIDIKYQYEIWKPGEIVIGLNDTKSNSTIIINEVNWSGWKYETCKSDNDCRTSIVKQDPNSILLGGKIEEDDRSIRFYYETPYMKISWFLFYLGIALLVIAMFLIRPSVVKSNSK